MPLFSRGQQVFRLFLSVSETKPRFSRANLAAPPAVRKSPRWKGRRGKTELQQQARFYIKTQASPVSCPVFTLEQQGTSRMFYRSPRGTTNLPTSYEVHIVCNLCTYIRDHSTQRAAVSRPQSATCTSRMSPEKTTKRLLVSYKAGAQHTD